MKNGFGIKNRWNSNSNMKIVCKKRFISYTGSFSYEPLLVNSEPDDDDWIRLEYVDDDTVGEVEYLSGQEMLTRVLYLVDNLHYEIEFEV